ncbi:acyl carrier protein [Actinoplanes sp. RD1]|uniref:acyl carrier protein n=1 Tax=Actinoplanes sp. RD1 TaxID=3064538 RepID=UPI0027405453|nr:acyl carrier protein [Actinoplanes sp. RD1]
MTSPTGNTVLDPERVGAELIDFIEGRTKRRIEPDLDIFTTGLVSSLFALELVVHVENTYDVAVGGPDLRLDNFRTIKAVTALILRLRGEADG